MTMTLVDYQKDALTLRVRALFLIINKAWVCNYQLLRFSQTSLFKHQHSSFYIFLFDIKIQFVQNRKKDRVAILTIERVINFNPLSCLFVEAFIKSP